jgi:hypothetical protein
MTIRIGELLKCKNCGAEFRWVPGNSTIKPKFCLRCHNKMLLERSNLSRNKTSTYKTGKYANKKNNGLKRRKNEKERARNNADKWFSIYIRIKYAYRIVNGEVICNCIINPNIIKHAKNMDNGHCFSRKFLSTRYEEDNCRPQNRSSNRFSGEADHYKFRDNLKNEIGEEKFNRLDELRKQEGTDTEDFYLKQADKYRKLVNELVKQKQIKKWW